MKVTYVTLIEATASALDSEGWLRTGDLCYFDQDGCLHIVDRVRDLIKCKAHQVSPAELEQIMKCHPKIDDVAPLLIGTVKTCTCLNGF
ncbi:putative AMP-dependent synthetase/ligase [Dioscorea sansibarensis]